MLVNLKSNERALLTRNGKPLSLLSAGKYNFWFARNLNVEVFNLDRLVTSWTPELEAVLSKDEGVVVTLCDKELALISVDGVANRVLQAGKFIVWTSRKEVNIDIISVDALMLDVPDAFWELMPRENVAVKVVRAYESTLLYVDGELNSVLSAGRYLISRYFRSVVFETFDMRERELLVNGQDLMTADKATIRINLILKFRVVDAKRAVEEVKDVDAALYTLLQMAARNYVAGVSVDALLEGRGELSESLFAAIYDNAKLWGVEVLRADVKDIILPGDMKSILNQVIFAEKQAQANLITRREETAATRSLANTAKMYEKNPMLLRLKELDAMQSMVSNAENLTIVTGKDKFLEFS